MNILYLADIRFPLERANGIQTTETCHALAARGHRVALVVRPDSHEPPRDALAFYGLPPIPTLAIEVVPIGGPAAAKRTGYVTFALGRALGRARQDVIFTRDLGVASLLLRIPRAQRAPVIYEAHGIAAETAAALPELLTGAARAPAAKLRRLAARDARVWRLAEGYVTITAGLLGELERRYGPRPHTAVVPDGTALGAPLPDPSTESDRPFTIGYAGHLYPWKGVEMIIEAALALPDARALIVGGHDREPDLERLKVYARDLDCADGVEFTGAVPPADVARHLARADALVLPNRRSAISDRFTSPLKLFEYMTAGRPIVASDLPSIREVLTHERNALLAEAGNPHAFVAAITRLKDDRALGARLAAQARADVVDYTWAKRAERLDAFFETITTGGADPRGAPR